MSAVTGETLYFYNGATGGLGRYLAEALTKEGVRAIPIRARLEDTDGARREISAAFAVAGKLKEAVFFQLASLVSVPACEQDPQRAHQTNVVSVVQTMQTFISEAKKAGIKPRVLYVSSGHLYAPKLNGRIREEDPLLPRSVYAKTKLEAENALTELCQKETVSLLIARVFGLIAPDQPENYVLPGLIRRAREKKLEQVPGLDNERDYLDSRDVCRALVSLGKDFHSTFAIINVCSGKGVSIRQVLELALKSLYGETGKTLFQKVTVGPSRPDDIASIVGDPTRFIRLIGGGNPKQISLEQTVTEATQAKKPSAPN